MYSSRSPYHDPRLAELSSMNEANPLQRSYEPRIAAVNPCPTTTPGTVHIMNLHLKGSSQRVPPSMDWQHQAPSNDWPVTQPPIPPPFGLLEYCRNVPPPPSCYSAQPPNVCLPLPPLYHSDRAKNFRSPPLPLFGDRRGDPIDRTSQIKPWSIHGSPYALVEGRPRRLCRLRRPRQLVSWYREGDSIGRKLQSKPSAVHITPNALVEGRPRRLGSCYRKGDSIGRKLQSKPSAIHITPNALFKGSTCTNNASTAQPSLDDDATRRKHESNDTDAKECGKVVADGTNLLENALRGISGSNISPCAAAGATESSPNRIDQLKSANVEERVQSPKISIGTLMLKVKSEEVLLDPLIIKTENKCTIEAKKKTTTCQSFNFADAKRKSTSGGESIHDSSMDAVSRDHVLYRFLVSETAMKGLSRCMDDGQTVSTVDEAQLVQDVLMLLLFLKSHGNLSLLRALGVLDVLAAQNVKGHFVVTHQASSQYVTLSISEHNFFKNFIRNVRPTLTNDSYGILFKNGESSFSDISLRQALRYCWAKAQVGLDAGVLWGCLGQVPDDSDLDTFDDQDTNTFAATSAVENQVPLVEQADVGEPSNSETENFPSSAAVLKDFTLVEDSLKEESSAILEQQPLLVQETPKSVAVDTSLAAAIQKEQLTSIKRPMSVAVDTSSAADITGKLPGSRKRHRSVDVDTYSAAAVPLEHSVSKKPLKSVDVDTSPTVAVSLKQHVSKKPPKSTDVDASLPAAVPLRKHVSKKPPKSTDVDTSLSTAVPLRKHVSKKPPKSTDVDTSLATAVPLRKHVSKKPPKSTDVDASLAAAVPLRKHVSKKHPKSADVVTSSTAIIPLKQLISKKPPKSVAENAPSTPAVQASPDKNAVCSGKLEDPRTKKHRKSKTIKPIRPCKQILEKQCSRWPISVLHELCPGLKYSVSEERAPGLYYPVFKVSAVVGGQRLSETAPTVKRAKFHLAQLTLKCVYDIENVHEGSPSALERKEAKRKTHCTPPKKLAV